MARVKMGWSKEYEDGSEVDFTLACEVTPPDDGRHGTPDQWSEPYAGDVEVLEVREAASGLLRDDLLEEAQSSIDCAEALEIADDNRRAAEEAYWDAEREVRSERLTNTLFDIARR